MILVKAETVISELKSLKESTSNLIDLKKKILDSVELLEMLE